jgi:fructosamine-3-kinase
MNADITGLTPLSGGSISRAWKAETTAGALLVKTGAPSDLPMFEKEAEGLNEIAATRTIPVPQVYGCGMVETISYIVMTFVQGDEASDTAERLGRGVAAMHAVTGDRFGFRHDNFIGRLPQPNGWCADWTTFLRDRRLGFQLEMAIRRGHMPVGRRKRMERLLANLERWIPKGVAPSLLHGDLWGGNWVVGPGGQPHLIDPAVFYGDAEMELAFTELFGGFPARFYDAYREVRPFDYNAYAERRLLYQLYYLLVHLNLFGESYGAAVDRVLARYVG